MKRFITGLMALLVITALAASAAFAGSKGHPGGGVAVGICHMTGKSPQHPYGIYITPDESGVYDGHVGHQYADDIIPAFSYVNAQGDTISFAGQNLGLVDGQSFTGQDLLDNGCAAPSVTENPIPVTPVAPTFVPATCDTGADVVIPQEPEGVVLVSDVVEGNTETVTFGAASGYVLAEDAVFVFSFDLTVGAPTDCGGGNGGPPPPVPPPVVTPPTTGGGVTVTQQAFTL